MPNIGCKEGVGPCPGASPSPSQDSLVPAPRALFPARSPAHADPDAKTGQGVAILFARPGAVGSSFQSCMGRAAGGVVYVIALLRTPKLPTESSLRKSNCYRARREYFCFLHIPSCSGLAWNPSSFLMAFS